MTPPHANGHQQNDDQGAGADVARQPLPEQVAELAGELSEAETAPARSRLARRISGLAGRSGQATWRRVQTGQSAARQGMQAGRAAARRGGPAAARVLRASGTWLAGQVLEMAPKIPVRDLAKLRAQYPGCDIEELADLLISAAARASAGVGASVGAAAAVPFTPTAPVQLGVETLALVAIELKLTAELHEVYGRRADGSAPERMLSYVGAWANRRGIASGGSGVAMAVGTPFRRTLERRLIAKAGQSTFSLTPLFAGAAAGALIDHRETRRLGDRIRADLRKHAAG